MANVSFTPSFSGGWFSLLISITNLQAGYDGERYCSYSIYNNGTLQASGSFDLPERGSTQTTGSYTHGFAASTGDRITYEATIYWKNNSEGAGYQPDQTGTGSYTVPRETGGGTITPGDPYHPGGGGGTVAPALPLWDWFQSNGQASAYQTSSAYEAATGRGKVSDFSYLVWNDLCDKVLAVRQSKGGSWDGRYLSLQATKMSANSKELTAARFNSLRYNVYSGYPEVSRGDPVYGDYFIDLTNAVNRGIGTGA